MTTPHHSASAPSLARLSLGTAPDSWGVWFPRDDHQVGWEQYLDEVAEAGYLHTELGPQGFLPQDPAQLRDELASRNLTVTGGTVFAGLHKGNDALDKAKDDFGREARLLREVGAEYLVHLPEQYTDMHGGALTESADIDPDQWQNLVRGTNELARYLLEEYGVKLVFHPHADTHVDTQDRVERFLLRHRPGAGQPVPGHGAHLLLRREQRRDHRAVPGADHLRPPQAGRPGGPRARPSGEAVARRGGAAGRDVRAAVRRAGLPAAARRARDAGP